MARKPQKPKPQPAATARQAVPAPRCGGVVTADPKAGASAPAPEPQETDD